MSIPDTPSYLSGVTFYSINILPDNYFFRNFSKEFFIIFLLLVGKIFRQKFFFQTHLTSFLPSDENFYDKIFFQKKLGPNVYWLIIKNLQLLKVVYVSRFRFERLALHKTHLHSQRCDIVWFPRLSTSTQGFIQTLNDIKRCFNLFGLEKSESFEGFWHWNPRGGLTTPPPWTLSCISTVVLWPWVIETQFWMKNWSSKVLG